ncbi:MAG: hypothetical protein NWP69_05235, partial [Congregibacter sp.]|nr:hypothetical protein [Congregibacter sp.]
MTAPALSPQSPVPTAARSTHGPKAPSLNHNDAVAGVHAVRHDWQRDEVAALFALSFSDLVFR